MAMLGVASGSLQVDSPSCLAWSEGRGPLGTIPHSSYEPGELLQWLCCGDSTINIIMVIVIMILLADACCVKFLTLVTSPVCSDGFMMRPPPFLPVPPPLLDGRPLPPNFPDMRFAPPRFPPPVMDRRYPDERSPPPHLPFDPAWLPPPLPGGRSPPYMDRCSPRDGDRSPSSFHSSVPASSSSASLNRTNVASTSGSRSRVKSPPRLVDRGPPHVARPRPEFGVPSPGVRGMYQMYVTLMAGYFLTLL